MKVRSYSSINSSSHGRLREAFFIIFQRLLGLGIATACTGKGLSGQGFAFTPQQIDNLTRWAEFLQTDESKKWDRDEREASSNFNRILSEAKFSEGKDIDANQLDNLLGNMRRMINNRALTKLLYMDNGIPNFNSRLRNLLLGSGPLPERIDEFYELDWVGKTTMSQFLYAFDPERYPCITRQTFDTFGLDSAQLDVAYRQALHEHDIVRVEDHNILTLEYLRDWTAFREVKRLLRLELYTHVNHILWNIHRTRRKKEPQAGVEGDFIPIAAHEDAEGVLILLGNLLGFDTYTSDPSKIHAGKKLGDIAGLKEIPAFTHQKILDTARKIDVIWFREEFPEYCFEVEHTTNVKDGLLRLYQVRKLDTKFFIVAPQDVHSKFETEVERDPFNSIRSRYVFKSYEDLMHLHQAAAKYHALKSRFGIG